MLRGPSFADSLNGDILAVSCEHRPSDPCKLVGQGYGHDVTVCSRKQSLNPSAERRILLGETWESRARPMEQQHPQVTVAALADVQQPRFSTCRRLARHQSQPSCQVTAAAERLSIAHRRHKGGRRQHADPRDPDQTLGGVLIAYPFGELIVKPFDPTIDASSVLAFTAQLETCTVAMEACCGAHHLGRQLVAQGHVVRLMSPAYVKPYVKAQKNDERDAEAIAEAATRPTMRYVEIKGEAQLEVQSLHRVRGRLVAERTALINQLRALMLERGIAVATPHACPQ
jgi:hypothetical protein